jgi:2-succinyl-6-hydroxy-2,4-cyclohexadiene-1-carboxylate synthase
MPENLILLHGFGGTHRAWDGVLAQLDDERYLAKALDLPGHGQLGDIAPPITFPSCVRSVLERAPQRFVLVGYSLGGRVALHIALAAPERVSRLILVSCSPGIEDPTERRARRESDERLAEDLEEGPFEEFIERWRTQPLFAGDPPEVARLARADQRRNDPSALAAVMRGIGTGRMEPLWPQLTSLEMPVVVLAGERDTKFVALGRRMSELIDHGVLVVIPGGHGLALENPAAVAQAIAAC